MFDDYDYKNTESRLSVRYVQKRDEAMYPWEIASFLKAINTVYYKYELLNSICSAIKFGIDPKDIFVFSKSIPLNKKHFEMNLLDEQHAAALFYNIGSPHPLVPNSEIYSLNLIYQYFRLVNSLLKRRGFRPLTIKSISMAYAELKNNGLDSAENYVNSIVIERSLSGVNSAKKNYINKSPITNHEINLAVSKYQKRKILLLDDLERIGSLGDSDLDLIIDSQTKDNKRRSGIILSFFRYFDKISRPLVCVRVGESKFRVLGRSLVNKNEVTGLELKEIKKNSPLGSLFEGGVGAMIKTVEFALEERRKSELHKLELEKKTPR